MQSRGWRTSSASMAVGSAEAGRGPPPPPAPRGVLKPPFPPPAKGPVCSSLRRDARPYYRQGSEGRSEAMAGMVRGAVIGTGVVARLRHIPAFQEAARRGTAELVA